MTVNDVRTRVKAIREKAGDDKVAHGMEDELHTDVLTAIARGDAENPSAVAAEALKTLKLDFSRWCE